MAKIFYWLLPFYLLSFIASTAGEEIFGWSIFLLFLFQISFDLKKYGLKIVLLNLKTHIDFPILFFGLWALLATQIIFNDKSELVYTLNSIKWIFIFYGFSYLFKKYFSINYDKYLNFILVCTTLVGIYGVVQMFTRIDLIRSSNEHISVIGNFYRATGFFSVPLTYAYCIGMVGIFGLTTLVIKIKNNQNYFLELTSTIATIAALIASSTRGAWIAFFVAALLVTFLADKKKSAITLAISIIFAALLMLEPSIKERVYSITNTTDYSSNTQRIDIWRANFAMFKDHPILGVGIERGRQHLLEYYEKLGVTDKFEGHAHNDFLNTLSGLGAPGTIAWIWFSVYFIILSYRLYKRATDSRIQILALGAFGSLVYVYIGGITQCNFYDNEVKHIIVFTWTLLVGINYYLSKNEVL